MLALVRRARRHGDLQPPEAPVEAAHSYERTITPHGGDRLRTCRHRERPRRRRRRVCRLQSRPAAPEAARRAKLTIVDNLLSAESVNVPDHPAVEFVARLDRRRPGAARVAGRSRLRLPPRLLPRQPVVDPRSARGPREQHADHAEAVRALKDFRSLKKVVYAAAGCAVAEKTFDGATATTEDAPVSLFHDSPYSISKLDRRDVRQLLFHPLHSLPFVKARFQNVYGPGEILGAGRWRGTPHTVWRNVTPTFVWKALHGEALPVENGGIASRDFIFVEDMARGLMACALQRRAWRNLQSRLRRRDDDPRARRADQRATGNATPIALTPARDWDRSGQRFASTDKAREKLGFVAEITHQDGIRRTVEWTKEKSLDPALHEAHAHFVPEVRKYA